jgi:hypothetical protein
MFTNPTVSPVRRMRKRRKRFAEADPNNKCQKNAQMGIAAAAIVQSEADCQGVADVPRWTKLSKYTPDIAPLKCWLIWMRKNWQRRDKNSPG